MKKFEELKKDEIFCNLFKNIANDIDIEDEIDSYGDEFITDYTRSVYLLSKWNEQLKIKGKSIKTIEDKIDRVVRFYITLVRYVGEHLHDMDSEGREVFEVWIIKAGIEPIRIKQHWKSIDEFYNFLISTKTDFSGSIFDEEEMKDLQRVADEFNKGIWEKNNEDYSDWRQRNIIEYM